MKNFITYLFCVLFGFSALAQTGVNTTEPKGELDVVSETQGFIPPRISDIENAVVNPQGGSLENGTLVYDKDLNCIRYVSAGEWTGCIAQLNSIATVSNICNGFDLDGLTLVKDLDISSNNVGYLVTIQNDSFNEVSFSVDAVDVQLSGASSGLTVGSPQKEAGSGDLASNQITLTSGQNIQIRYPITGAFNSTGVLKATWSKLKLRCSDEVQVQEAPVKVSFAQATSTVTEGGNTGQTTGSITVSLSKAVNEVVTVDFSAAVTTGSAKTNFTPNSGTLTFAVNETSKTIDYSFDNDNVETESIYTYTLSNTQTTFVGGALLGDQTTNVLTIAEDDTPTPLRIGYFNNDGYEINSDLPNYKEFITKNVGDGKTLYARGANQNGKRISSVEYVDMGSGNTLRDQSYFDGLNLDIIWVGNIDNSFSNDTTITSVKSWAENSKHVVISSASNQYRLDMNQEFGFGPDRGTGNTTNYTTSSELLTAWDVVPLGTVISGNNGGINVHGEKDTLPTPLVSIAIIENSSPEKYGFAAYPGQAVLTLDADTFDLNMSADGIVDTDAERFVAYLFELALSYIQ